MILASAILLPILAISVWLFARAKPKRRAKDGMRRFNIATLGVVIVSCAIVSLYFWQTTGQGIDRAWWPILAFFYSILATIMVLIIAALVRARIFRGEATR